MRISGRDIFESCPVCGSEYIIKFNSIYRHFEFAIHSSGGLTCPGTHYDVPQTAVWKTIVARIEKIQKHLKLKEKP